MTALQKQVMEIISSFPEEKLIEIINILTKLSKQQATENNTPEINAFLELKKMSDVISHRIPSDFDADKELEEALWEKYEKISN